MKSTHNLLVALALISTNISLSNASVLDINDYCDSKVSRPATVKEMRPLADGVTYSAISDDGESIEVYSYKTGKKESVLFSIKDIKGDTKISEFDGYEISSNGKKILLWNNVEKIYRHSFTADYYVYDIMRYTLSKISEKGKERGAVMSHDGRCVAYVVDNNIRIANLDYKTDIAVTTDGETNKVINGVSDWGYEEEFGIVNTMCWSADDNILAYIRFDESKVPTYSFDNYRSYCDSDPLGDPYPAQYSYKYPLAGYPNSVVSVHSFNLDTRVVKTMQLGLNENDYVPSMKFDGAEENLMVMILNRDQNNLRLFRVNPSSTVAKCILTETSTAWLDPAAYQMVRYDRNNFVIGSERTGWRHLYQYDYNGNLLRTVTKGDFNVTAFYGYDSAKNMFYMQTTSLGAINRNVASVDAKGNLKLLHNTPGYETAQFSRNFQYYFRSYSNSKTPTQYTVWSAAGKKLADIEMNEEYARKYSEAPTMEFLTVKNEAGDEMNAYIIKPTDFDANKKYPLMMYQYNGPDSQEVVNRWRIEGLNYIASKGYIVAAVDGRGTGNRSRKWANCVYKHLGEFETQDQIAGANYFRTLPYIDADKCACFGWSYGGYMTLMELSQPGNPFTAGISMAPVTDWRYYDSIYTERFMQTPAQNFDGYEKSSALNRTAVMNKKLLIMSGTSDDNVHIYNMLKYTSKLNYEGKLFDMMSYTGFEHSLRDCNAKTQLFRKIIEFLESNVK